jgi:hypothetical protein
MAIVPWIKAADPAKEFLQAYQTSAQIAQANARMAQSAAQADREYALQQQAMEQRQQRQQRQDEQDAQQLEVTKSYREQQMRLGQQKLAQEKVVSDARTKQAAAGFVRDQNIKKRIAAGEDPLKVHLEEGGPGLSAAIQATERRSLAEKPEGLVTKTQDGETFQQRGGKWFHIPNLKPTTDTVTETIPAVEGSPAVPAQPASTGFLGFGARAAIPAQPAIPGRGEQKRTRHVPVQLDTASGSLMDAYRAKTATGTAPTATGSEPPQITTQEQYDALTPGSIYIGKGGKRYRKPGNATPPSIFKDQPVDESSHDEDQGGGNDGGE